MNLHDASNKIYVDAFDNDTDALNIEEIILDSHMHDEISILGNFIKARPSMLCFNKVFEFVEEGLRLKPSIEEPPTLELKPLHNHLHYAYLGINETLLMIISSMFRQEE